MDRTRAARAVRGSAAPVAATRPVP